MSKAERDTSSLVSSPPHGYRPCVGIFLLDGAAKRVFVGHRLDTEVEAWQMPQGGIDPGEDVVVAGFREMREEIGTDRAELLRASDHWRPYDLPRDIAARMWGGRYRGQAQRWLAFRFLGQDSDIDLEGPHPEFHRWKWARPEELPDLVVPFKREIYLSVVEEFRPLWA